MKTKVQHCKRCNEELIVSKYALNDFDRYCDSCKIALNNEKFIGIKDIDYVECPGCGFRSKSLEGHYRKDNGGMNSWKKCEYTRKELIKQFGDFRIFCKNSDLKAKNTRRQNSWYKNRKKTIKQMSKSFLKHIDLKGKTKKSSAIIRKMCETKQKHFADGTVQPHNKGKTKESYKPLVNAGRNIVVARKLKFWRSNVRIIPLEVLEQFKNEKGEIVVSKVLANIKISFQTLIKNIKHYNLKYQTKSKIFQETTLKRISDLIHSDYISEVTFKKLNKPTDGKHHRFDGYFPEENLLVEVQGYQHYNFPNNYHKTLEAFETQKENDEYKKQKALEHGFKFLEIKDSDNIETKLQSLNLVTKEA
jgi:hypothetical protein